MRGMDTHEEPETVRPGALMSREKYRELVRSTVPPAPPVPQIAPEKSAQLVLSACQHTIERSFMGRSEQLRVVRNAGSLTVIVTGPANALLGRIIVSKRFGKEVYNVWVQQPPSGPGSCGDISRRVDVALLMDELLPRLKIITEG